MSVRASVSWISLGIWSWWNVLLWTWVPISIWLKITKTMSFWGRWIIGWINVLTLFQFNEFKSRIIHNSILNLMTRLSRRGQPMRIPYLMPATSRSSNNFFLLNILYMPMLDSLNLPKRRNRSNRCKSILILDQRQMFRWLYLSNRFSIDVIIVGILNIVFLSWCIVEY